MATRKQRLFRAKLDRRFGFTVPERSMAWSAKRDRARRARAVPLRVARAIAAEERAARDPRTTLTITVGELVTAVAIVVGWFAIGWFLVDCTGG